MNPDEFLKELAATADADQGLAGARTMASVYAAFYLGLVAEDVDEYPACELTKELLRCTVGDHKPE